MVEEMVELGFKRIELSHGIRISLVPGILQAVEEGLIEISSVHNFCPLPRSVQHAAPNLFQPSAADRRECALWKNYTEQTLDFATKVNANRVVMHSGSVWFFFGSPERKFDQWVEKAGLEPAAFRDNEEFTKRRERAMKRIRKASSKLMPQVQQAYEDVAAVAKEKGICFGLENREGLEELPLDDEFAEFLKESLPDASVFGYWHDTGHAQLKDLAGLLTHREHLEAMADRLIGFHLHDVSTDGRDHQVPGSGCVDFKMVSEFVRPEHTLVLELSPRLTAEQVLQSRDYIAEVLG